MNTRQTTARKGAMLAALLLGSIVLAGCGGGLRVITPEVDDAAAIQSQSAFHIKPVVNQTNLNPEWEIEESEWPGKCDEWTSQFAEECANAGKSVYTLGPGAEAKEGALVEFTVIDMNLGTYAYFYKAPGWIKGAVTITDIKSGKVIFKGTVDSPGTTSGVDRYSYEGRIGAAHRRVGRDIAWLIDRQQ